MGDLSEHFNRSEFECKCGCEFDAVDAALVAGLEMLRRRAGAAVTVLSGCRCAEHNRAVGGAERSQHVAGRAADVQVAGLDPRQVYAMAREIPQLRGFGVDDERGFVHVDTREVGAARWCYHQGREAKWHEVEA